MSREWLREFVTGFCFGVLTTLGLTVQFVLVMLLRVRLEGLV